MIGALLFDFDGVIVDTEVPTYQSWRDTYAEYGVDLALADWLPDVGSGSSISGAFDASPISSICSARPSTVTPSSRVDRGARPSCTRALRSCRACGSFSRRRANAD